MKTCFTLCLLHLALLTPAWSEPDVTKGTGKIATPRPLTDAQQKSLLERRISGSMLGSLNSYTSLLFAVHDIIIHSDEKDLGKITLNSPFPDFYKPTCAELFNAIGRQTGTTWRYDSKRAFWLFSKPGRPLPFTIKLAEGWTSEDRGNYLFCKPPAAPMGMDIYVMAEYSGDQQDQDLTSKMREGCAMIFARNFKKDVTAKDMTMEKIGSLEALHFKLPAPRPGITWRQWAIAKDGRVIVIVSAMNDNNETAILPGVLEALRTFELAQ